MATYAVYALTPKGQMLGPVVWVEANSDHTALNEAQAVVDNLLGAKVLDNFREVGIIPPRALPETH